MDTLQLAAQWALTMLPVIKLSAEAISTTVGAMSAARKFSIELLRKDEKNKTDQQKNPWQAYHIFEVSDANTVTKGDIAIIVDINQSLLVDVAAYLGVQNINADLVLITNNSDYGSKKLPLSDDPDEWRTLIRQFASTVQDVRMRLGSGGAKIHVFMAVPVVLAFGMGAVWGTVSEAVVYHWAGSTYFPAFVVDRNLRF